MKTKECSGKHARGQIMLDWRRRAAWAALRETGLDRRLHAVLPSHDLSVGACSHTPSNSVCMHYGTDCTHYCIDYGGFVHYEALHLFGLLQKLG